MWIRVRCGVGNALRSDFKDVKTGAGCASFYGGKMTSSSPVILIALGANLPSRFGLPEQSLREAVSRLVQKEIFTIQSSRVYLTAPVPVSDQPWYHNMVVRVKTAHAPKEVLACLHEIEEEMGRVRVHKNEARVIDLDLLAYGDEIFTGAGDDGFILPHPRMHERAFVMLPLRDVAPEWIHPVTGKNVDEIVAQLGVIDGIRILGE